jgi:hypothetical protein
MVAEPDGGPAREEMADYLLPTSITYVSSKGVTFGATVEQVLAARGTPKRVQNYQHSQKLGVISYCGISFSNAHVGHASLRMQRLEALPRCLGALGPLHESVARGGGC